MKNNILWILLAVLLALFIGSKLFNKKPQRSYEPNFITFDQSTIDKITIHPKEGQGDLFSLIKADETWKVKNETIEAQAMISAVESLLTTASELKATRVVAKSEEKWPEYEVDNEKGKKIEFFQKGKLVEEIFLGRFDFNQQARSAKSYVRHKDDNNVYVVDGFVSMTMGQSIDAFRNKELVNIGESEISEIETKISGQLKKIRKENYWVDAENNMIDSTSINNYLTGISKVSGSEIVDEFSIDQASEIGQVRLQLADGSPTIKLTCYSMPELTKPFVVHSSANPTEYFASDSAGVYKTIFGSLGELMN